MKSVRLYFLCFLLSITGCIASLSNIRQSEPAYILHSNKAPEKLANCIAYESQAAIDSWNRFWDPAKITENDGAYKMLITLSGGLFVSFSKPMAELIISPDDSTGSNIECRTYSYWGGKEKFWDLVKHCASP